MTSEASRSKHQRPRDAVAFVRLVLSWMLVAVLAVDLIASPLHAHRHDGEWSSGGTLWAAAGHPDGLHSPGSVHSPVYVDHDDAPGFSHSISALRGHAKGMADVRSLDETAVAPPWLVLALQTPSGVASSTWPPDRPRAGSSAFKSLPPDGRAPPLHA